MEDDAGLFIWSSCSRVGTMHAGFSFGSRAVSNPKRASERQRMLVAPHPVFVECRH